MLSTDCLNDKLKDKPGLSPATQAALHAPDLKLAACVRCYLSRSTLGAALRPSQRLNHFPSSVYVTLNWHLAGTIDRAWMGEDEWVPQGIVGTSFCGPRTVPMCSRNPGPVHTFSVALMPDAVQALTGLDMSAHVNQAHPLHQVLDANWQAMARDVQNAADDHQRITFLEQFLLPRWQAVRHQTVSQVDQISAWVQALLIRAATSGLGQSARQQERRVKTWAGLSKRELRGLARAEAGFIQGQAERARDADASFADLAALTGYADQAHLSRITRKVTGLSPTELMKAINEEESFWSYRLF